MMFDFDSDKLQWIREPKIKSITQDKVVMITEPNTDLWQRTYYGFQNDNAPILYLETDEQFFSFTVKTEFKSKQRFDQCGVVIYQDSDNWLKASVEYENDEYQRLGSVVTNHSFSDWATTDVSAEIQSMYYRLSRRKSDYCIECSEDGVNYKQMRICHLFNGDGVIRFGIYACSPEQSAFEATFTEMAMTSCMWKSHK